MSTAASAVPPNPFANPMGMGAMGGMDMHSMQQQMMQNPEMMSQIMNSPMMQSLLDNPEIIQVGWCHPLPARDY